jgi:transcriptional regulator GlxA family with amidase domain
MNAMCLGVRALIGGIALLTAQLCRAEPREAYTRNVAIVIWNGAEILDWGGPSEVFESAGGFAQYGDERAFHVYTVSKSKDPIASQRFIDVLPDYSIEDAPRPDIVVFPGGGTSSVLQDSKFLAWATAVATEAEVALSVCTGAFILGKAGLLEDKDATTWYGAINNLEAQFPETRVHRGRRFIDNGQVVTTAGVSAGIDGSLHVVARLLGRHVADRTAQYMEYRWTPETHLAQTYTVLNPSLDERGRQIQQADIYALESNPSAAINIYEQVVADDPSDTTLWYRLASACYSSQRYEEAVEAYEKAAASEEARTRAYYNAACSAALMSDADRALEYLSKTIDSGFTNRDYIMSDPDLTALHEDSRFKSLVATMDEKNDRASR